MHDGPGLRTTIFFKGCPLDCPWCHNPEAKLFEPELMVTEGEKKLVGRQYTVEELVSEVLSDVMFYDHSGGGVTLSGGEVMAQNRTFLLELARQLKAKGISLGVDTCGVAAQTGFSQLAKYVDFWLYDLKFISSEDHKKWTGAANDLVLKNLEFLNSLRAKIYLRMILLEGLNTSADVIEETMLWLKTHSIELVEVDLLPYHRLGQNKFAGLGLEPQTFTTPSEETLRRVKEQVLRYYPMVRVGG
jgi:pyruvate formate lyase activating enzyme